MCLLTNRADLEITPEELQFHKNLVIEAQKLFNSRHYGKYDFLFSVSDVVSGKGLEHHQSSEDGSRANYFTDWGAGVGGRALLPARIRAFVEWQVSTSGGFVDAEFQCAHAQRIALGL